MRWQPYAAGVPVLSTVSVCQKPCVSLQTGIDFRVENLSKSQTQRCTLSTGIHHPRSVDLALPIREHYIADRSFVCHWWIGPRCGAPPGNAPVLPEGFLVAFTSPLVGSFTCNPKPPETHTGTCDSEPLWVLLFWGILGKPKFD